MTNFVLNCVVLLIGWLCYFVSFHDLLQYDKLYDAVGYQCLLETCCLHFDVVNGSVMEE
jgi:hypothetical protein